MLSLNTFIQTLHRNEIEENNAISIQQSKMQKQTTQTTK